MKAMKKFLFLIIYYLSVVGFCFGQNPLLRLWVKRFGGTNDDGQNSWLPQPSRKYLQQTTDDGYIIGGYSLSGISGDKTQATRGDWDYWFVKFDSVGNKQWDKDFGGTY